VSYLRTLHQIANPAHIKRPKLVPFSHKDHCVGLCHRGVLVLSIVDVRQNLSRLSHCYGVISTNSCAAFKQAANDLGRRRLSHVICLGLESKAEHGDRLTLQITNKPFDLWQHCMTLAAIDLDHGIYDQRIAVELTRY